MWERCPLTPIRFFRSRGFPTTASPEKRYIFYNAFAFHRAGFLSNIRTCAYKVGLMPDAARPATDLPLMEDCFFGPPRCVAFGTLRSSTAIVSENIKRRHLNAGQRAILLADAYPDPDKGGRGKTKPLELLEVHSGDLSQARCICKWAPEWIEEILAFEAKVIAAKAAREKRLAEGRAREAHRRYEADRQKAATEPLAKQ